MWVDLQREWFSRIQTYFYIESCVLFTIKCKNISLSNMRATFQKAVVIFWCSLLDILDLLHQVGNFEHDEKLQVFQFSNFPISINLAFRLQHTNFPRLQREVHLLTGISSIQKITFVKIDNNLRPLIMFFSLKMDSLNDISSMLSINDWNIETSKTER